MHGILLASPTVSVDLPGGNLVFFAAVLLKPVREQPLFEALVNVIIGKKPELYQPVKIVGGTAFVRAALQKSLRRWAGSGNIWPMLSQVCSAAVSGIDAYAVEVEVNCGYGDTFIAIVAANHPHKNP